jgi:L-ascorbate metabolism protein UlaG (beta-lactamase superfamily)
MNHRNPFRILFAAALGCWLGGCATARDSKTPLPTRKDAVTIEYIAHACFRLTSPAGKQILLDPYASRVWLGYDFPANVRADAVLISHPHYDHDGGEAMRRPVPWTANTLVLRGPGTNRIGDVTAIGFAGKHADPWGKEFGQSNTIWLLEFGRTSSVSPQSSETNVGTRGTRPSNEDRARGIRIVHLGDNGPLRDEAVRQFGRVDVLMIPIDSRFHILQGHEIAAIRNQLSPAFLIPMHYRHDDLETSPEKPEQLGGIDEWAKGEANVRYLKSNTKEFSIQSVPAKPEVLIFKHSPLVRPRK